MKIKGWIITQALKKEYQGVKAFNHPDACMVFEEERLAYDYLYNLVFRRKEEIALGIRDKDNLDKEKGLDFCVTECEITFSPEELIKRGWTINKHG